MGSDGKFGVLMQEIKSANNWTMHWSYLRITGTSYRNVSKSFP